MEPDLIALGILWYIVFLLSLTCHEAAHALAAMRGGDLTAYLNGQVTLNPLPHIRQEPFGTVLVPLLSFVSGGAMIGWASAPYDPYWAARHPKRAAWMSLAGPAANFALVLIAALLIHAGIIGGLLRPPDVLGFSHVVESAQPGYADGIAKALSILFSLNLMLGAFNLLPVPPLDGFGVLGLFVSEEMAARLRDFKQSQGFLSAIGLLVAWQFFGDLFRPLLRAAFSVLYPGMYS